MNVSQTAYRERGLTEAEVREYMAIAAANPSPPPKSIRRKKTKPKNGEVANTAGVGIVNCGRGRLP